MLQLQSLSALLRIVIHVHETVTTIQKTNISITLQKFPRTLRETFRGGAGGGGPLGASNDRSAARGPYWA